MMQSKKQKIGIIGFGQMGQFMAKHLKPFAEIEAFDLDDKIKEAEKLGIRFTTLDKAASNDILLLFPPIVKMEDCCKMIRPHLRKGAIIIEGCSLMEQSVKHMQDILPEDVDIIGSHALFGPESGKDGIKGLSFVLSDVRTDNLDKIKDLFSNLNLNIIEMTPAEHDKLMADTLAIEELVGRILMKLDIREQQFATPGFKLLLQMRAMVENDTDELVKALFATRFARQNIDDFTIALEIIKRDLT